MVIRRDQEVQIEVTSRHQHVSEKTRTFAMERARKLTRYNDRVSHIQVLLDERHEDFITEMIVHVDSGSTLVAKERAKGYRTSLDAVLTKLEKQLKRDKERRRNHKHEAARNETRTADVGRDRVEETFDDAVVQRLDR